MKITTKKKKSEEVKKKKSYEILEMMKIIYKKINTARKFDRKNEAC